MCLQVLVIPFVAGISLRNWVSQLDLLNVKHYSPRPCTVFARFRRLLRRLCKVERSTAGVSKSAQPFRAEPPAGSNRFDPASRIFRERLLGTCAPAGGRDRKPSGKNAQNGEKSVFLMDGVDLHAVLAQQISLKNLLKGKLCALNLRTEPFASVRDLLN
jgi:hypothetical protein